MRVYWKIDTGKETLFTAYAVIKVVDKKTGIAYFPGEMLALKKSEAPKVLIEDTGKYDLHIKEEKFHFERRGLFGKQKVVTQFNGGSFQKELTGLNGFWEIVGTSPVIYTQKICDLLRDKETKQLYKRGELKIWWDEDYPMPLAEHMERFDFIYFAKDAPMTQEEYTREIWARGFFRKR